MVCLQDDESTDRTVRPVCCKTTDDSLTNPVLSSDSFQLAERSQAAHDKGKKMQNQCRKCPDNAQLTPGSSGNVISRTQSVAALPLL